MALISAQVEEPPHNIVRLGDPAACTVVRLSAATVRYGQGNSSIAAAIPAGTVAQLYAKPPLSPPQYVLNMRTARYVAFILADRNVNPTFYIIDDAGFTAMVKAPNSPDVVPLEIFYL